MKHLIKKLSAFLVMLMCVSAGAQAEIVHHTACAPTSTQRGFKKECWENTATGRIYLDAACSNELKDQALAQNVVYAALPKSPIIQMVDFTQSEYTTDWDVSLSWAAVTTFNNAYADWSTTPRYAEFKATGENVANARIVWNKNQGSIYQGKFTIKISVNGVEKFSIVQQSDLEGVFVQALPGVSKNDVVKFEVAQNTKASYSSANPTFKACLEYTFEECNHQYPTGSAICSKCGNIKEHEHNYVNNICTMCGLADNIIHHAKCEASSTHRGFNQECWEDIQTRKIYSDAACTKELERMKVITYPYFSNSNITEMSSEFQSLRNQTDWDITFNWAARTTYTKLLSSGERYVKFTVADDNAAYARLLWNKNYGDPSHGKYKVSVYVNGTKVYELDQQDQTIEGVRDVYFKKLKKGDIVRFSVVQTSIKDLFSSGDVFFTACLDYIIGEEIGPEVEYDIVDPDEIEDEADNLSLASPEGAVGTYKGKKAIIVNLGGTVGKVAIATKNVGAEKSTDYGSMYSYADANNISVTGLSDGWHVPSKEEMEALKARLTWNSEKRGAEINFDSKSLFLPAAGYNSNAEAGVKAVYWTSTGNDIQSRGWRLDMASSYAQVLEGNGATLCPVRPFCALPTPVHHAACSPTLTSLGFTKECWEDPTTGKYYSDASCTQELVDEALAKTVVYAKPPKSPIYRTNGFSSSSSTEVDWNVNINYAGVYTYTNLYGHEDNTPKSIEFKVPNEYPTNARIVWNRNQGNYWNGSFDVNIYVGDEQVFHRAQITSELFEGVFVFPLPNLKADDIVKFEVKQTWRASDESACPTFKASLEYTVSPDPESITYETVCEPTAYKCGYTQNCYRSEKTRKLYRDPTLFEELNSAQIETYAKLEKNPIISVDRFIRSETQVIDGVTFNWAAKTTYETPKIFDQNERSVCFQVLEDKTMNPRLKWSKTISDYNYGIYQVDIYVNDMAHPLTTVPLYLAGLYSYPLPELNKGDIVKFRVSQTFTGTSDSQHPVFTACFEYNLDPRTPITISAKDNMKYVGDADPELTWHVTDGQLAPGDQLSGISIIREAGEAVGTYSINMTEQKGANPNYRISFEPATFTIFNRGKLMTVTMKDNGRMGYYLAKDIKSISWTTNAGTPSMAIKKNDETVTYIAQDEMDNVSWNDVAEGADPSSLRFAFTKPSAPEGLSEVSPEGAIGTLNGREAIVVDLGGKIGKVAIATKNIGAADPYQRGQTFTFEDLNDPAKTGLYDGWRVPSKEELQALLNKLTVNTTGKKETAAISYEDATLLFTTTGYSYNFGTSGSTNNSSLSTDGIYLWSKTPKYYLQITSSTKTINNANPDRIYYLCVRPFCALPRWKNQVLPTETEHSLGSSSFRFTNDGLGITFTVNGQSVTYPLNMLEKMTFFNGTPSVALHANEDPVNTGNYYTTFYSGLEAYSIPEGVKAYTGKMEGDVVRLTEIEGAVLPQGEPVMLYSDATSDITMTATEDNGGKSSGNIFSGVDIETEQDGATYYMLSYGQDKLGFYPMNSTMMLAPNKAFIELSSSTQAKALRFIFPEDVATGISPLPTSPHGEEMIYNISGQRLSRLQHGINIVGGKKILVK